MTRLSARRLMLGRRAALGLPLVGLTGCSVFDDLFGSSKTPLPGRREGVMLTHRGLQVDTGTPPRVQLPPAVDVADWPQAGANPRHMVGRIAGPERLQVAWKASIGEGGGYRRKLTSAPVVAQGHVFAMDSDGVVVGLEAGSGQQIWDFKTEPRKSRSTNVGGGIAYDGGALYVSTGRAELLALDALKGTLKWRQPLGTPARSTPTVVEGHVFLTTISQEILAFDTVDGKRAWGFQGAPAETSVLGEPAAAYADGLVVAGFGSGDLVALRANTGGVAWTDGIASASGRTSLADVSAITGMPVIVDQRVYAIGLGGLLVAIDLRAGRRLWEREVAGAQTPWVAGDWMFIVTVDQQIAAISAVDGTVGWVVELPRYKKPEKQSDPVQWQGPVLIGEHLLVVGTDATGRLISPYTGETQTTFDLSDAAALAPVVAGGVVYVLTDDGVLTAFH